MACLALFTPVMPSSGSVASTKEMLCICGLNEENAGVMILVAKFFELIGKRLFSPHPWISEILCIPFKDQAVKYTDPWARSQKNWD